MSEIQCILETCLYGAGLACFSEILKTSKNIDALLIVFMLPYMRAGAAWLDEVRA